MLKMFDLPCLGCLVASHSSVGMSLFNHSDRVLMDVFDDDGDFEISDPESG